MRSSRVHSYRAYHACLATLLTVVGGCTRASKVVDRDPASSAGVASPVVAEVDGQPIFAADLRRYVAEFSPLSRGTTQEPGELRKSLRLLARFEVMVKEAKDMGLDRDPSVREAQERAMVTLLGKQAEANVQASNVSEEEIGAYFAAHPDEFVVPERVVVSQILVPSAALADEVYRLARSSPQNDRSRFAQLVGIYSVDEATRGRKGDLGFVDGNRTDLPKAVVAAALGLRKEGDISSPIATHRGFVILRLDRRSGSERPPLEAVHARIQQHLLSELRNRKMTEWTAAVLARHSTKFFDDAVR